MNKYLVTIVLLLLSYATGACRKHEMRGVWVATVWGIDWPSVQGTDVNTAKKQQAELSALLDRCKEMNLTTVVFQVRSMADAMYQSKQEPWSRFLTGKRGAKPAWDPLEWMVEECHNRGLECYAWVNPFRAPAAKDASTEFDKLCSDKGWLLTYGKNTTLNPGMEDVRKHIVDVCRDIVRLYDVDGLIFDDYFYPNGIPENASAPDYDLYLKSGTEMPIGQWRRANVHKLVADVSAMIFDECPDVRFGISPAGVAGTSTTSAKQWGLTPVDVKAADWQWKDIFSDPVGWLYEGTIDFVSPQLYWPTTHETAPFQPLARWWDYAAGRHGRHSFPSITLADMEKNSDSDLLDDHLLQVEMTGEMSTPGVILYSAKFLDRIDNALRYSLYMRKAISPRAEWKYPHKYEAVKGLHRKDDKLLWDETEPDVKGATVRYAVYAFPDKLSIEEVADTNDEPGIDSEYLLGITYTPEFHLPPGERKGRKYAVSVLDGNSIEHPYSIL
ncbi:MAG: family 10 glycosylhydrolase [Duncaniella sp.]|nr:family 10 glycosylhydrolase [Duncaniella sp.]